MNSVFSAFKSSKSEGSIQSNKVKKFGPANSSSYANLRHIREIGSSAKMSAFVDNNDDDDDLAPNLRMNKCATPQSISPMEKLIPIQSSSSTSTANKLCNDRNDGLEYENENVIDQCEATKPIEPFDRSICAKTNDDNVAILNDIESEHNENSRIVASSVPCINSTQTNATNNCILQSNIPSNVTQDISKTGIKNYHTNNGYGLANENKENDAETMPSTNNINNTSEMPFDSCENPDSTDLNNCHSLSDGNGKHTPILSAATNKKLTKHTNDSTLSASNKASSNRFYKRLSLSGIGNNPLPSVHGRSTQNMQNANNNGSGETKRTRISTHQRNLSLDFR